MNCADVRTYLGPFLDSELDPKTSYEVGLHLNACESCRVRVEGERKLEGLIAEALRRDPISPEMWVRALGRLQHGRRMTLRAGLAAAAALLLAAAGLWWFQPGASPDLVQAAVLDHEEYLAGRFGPEMATEDAVRAEAFLKENLSVGAALPASDATRKLVGVRRCTLEGFRLGLATYRIDGDPVSVFLGSESGLSRFPELEAELHRSGSIAREVRGKLVIARAVQPGDLAIVLVGDPARRAGLERLAGEIAAR